MLSDAKLVEKVRCGSTGDFGILIERYERTLLAIVLAELRDRHTAEDVVQSSFLQAYRKLETLRDPARFGSWLIQIARRQLIESIRTTPRIDSIPLDQGIGQEAIDRSAENPNWIEHEHLLQLVSQLPDDEQLLIGLRHFDGHSMAEIASICGRPVGSVTKQLSRAMVRLRDLCEKENSK